MSEQKRKIAHILNFLKFFTQKRMFRSVFRKIGKEKITGSVLDIGGGLSPFHDLVQSNEYTNIDQDASLNPTVVGNILAMPFSKNSFDSIICTEVLEHIAEPNMAIKEMHRVLKEKGYAYITVPMSWSLHYEPYDFYRFTKYGIKYLLEKEGFTVLKIHPIGGLVTTFVTRCINILYDFIVQVFSFIRLKRIGILFATMIAFLLHLLNSTLFRICDVISKEDPFDWAILARKK